MALSQNVRQLVSYIDIEARSQVFLLATLKYQNFVNEIIKGVYNSGLAKNLRNTIIYANQKRYT